MIGDDQDRRKELRALTAALVEVTDQHEDISTCVLEDLSLHGACVHSDIPFEAGEEIMLRVEDVSHSGRVKYSTATGNGYSIGIEFQNGEWPAPIHFPVHWIRPSR